MAGNSTLGFSGDGGLATLARIWAPSGIAIDASKNIYIADRGNSLIRKISSTGYISTVAGDPQLDGYTGDGGPAINAQLNSPYGVGVDAFGTIYFADTANFVVRMVTNDTNIISTVAGTGSSGYSGDGGIATSGRLTNPISIFVRTAGNVYVADNGANTIRKLSGYNEPTIAPTINPTNMPTSTFPAVLTKMLMGLVNRPDVAIPPSPL